MVQVVATVAVAEKVEGMEVVSEVATVVVKVVV